MFASEAPAERGQSPQTLAWRAPLETQRCQLAHPETRGSAESAEAACTWGLSNTSDTRGNSRSCRPSSTDSAPGSEDNAHC